MDKQFYVYILTNKQYGTLYTGVTSDLLKRVYEHKHGMMEGFTKEYGVHRLVYYEVVGNAISAIEREKRIKKWNRQWKVELIQSANPNWDDLCNSLIGSPLSRG